MSLRLVLAALCLAAAATCAQARPFTVDDLLDAEEFGQLGFSPGGRWLVFERLKGHAQSGPFDEDVYSGYRRSRLFVVDVRRPDAPAGRLLPAAADEGQVAGPFSPDGSRLVVLRRGGRNWEAGVASLASGEVEWLGITPELGLLGQTIAWRNDDELLIAARPPGEAPLRLRIGWEMREALATRWAEAASGERPSLTVVGSGRFRELRERAAPGALVQVDLRSGAVRRLAEGDFYDLEISPDGRQVAAMARLEDLQAPPQERLRIAAPTRRRNLLLLDLESGRTQMPCLACDLATHLIAWSDQRPEVLVYGRTVGAPWSEAKLIRLAFGQDPRPVNLGGLALSLAYTSEGYQIPPAGWLAGDPLVYAAAPDAPRPDWYRIAAAGPVNLTGRLPAPARRLVALDADNLATIAGDAVWRVDAEGRAAKGFAARAPGPVPGLGLSNRLRVSARSTGWVLAEDGAAGRVWRSTSAARLAAAPADGAVLATALAPQAVAQVVRTPEQTLALDLTLASGQTRRVMTLNPGFANIDFAEVRELQTRGADGAPLSHWLVLPPRSAPRAAARPPLIVIPYPGAIHTQAPAPYGGGTGRFAANAELLAARGYAVLVPSLPRPAGSEPGEGLAAQILAAVDLAAAASEVDAGRLGILGQSFAGYAALIAAAQSPRFAAVVASAAPTNLASVYGAIDPHHAVLPKDGLELNANYGWAELGQGGLGVAPWEDPARYVRNSPVFLADRIAAPVLLIHGDSDFVRLSEAQAMFSALYRQNKDAVLITAFGEGHIIASPANRREVWRLTFEWLDQVLGQGPAVSSGRDRKPAA